MKVFVLVLSLLVCLTQAVKNDGQIFQEGIKIVDNIITEVQKEIDDRAKATENKCPEERNAQADAEKELASLEVLVTAQNDHINDLQALVKAHNDEIALKEKDCQETEVIVQDRLADWQRIMAQPNPDYTEKVNAIDAVIEKIQELQSKVVRKTALSLVEVDAAMKDAPHINLESHSQSMIELRSALMQEPEEPHAEATKLKALLQRILDKLEEHKAALVATEKADVAARQEALDAFDAQKILAQKMYDDCLANLQVLKTKRDSELKAIEEAKPILDSRTKARDEAKTTLAEREEALRKCQELYNVDSKELGAELATLKTIRELLSNLYARSEEHSSEIKKVADLNHHFKKVGEGECYNADMSRGPGHRIQSDKCKALAAGTACDQEPTCVTHQETVCVDKVLQTVTCGEKCQNEPECLGFSHSAAGYCELHCDQLNNLCKEGTVPTTGVVIGAKTNGAAGSQCFTKITVRLEEQKEETVGG